MTMVSIRMFFEEPPKMLVTAGRIRRSVRWKLKKLC